MSLIELTTAWNTFFHAPESCAPYVLFRLLFGSLLTINVLLLFPVMNEFLAPNAIWNVTAWQKHQGRGRLCLLHLMPPTIGSVRTLLRLHLAACIAFTIGWQYRIASIIVFVTLVSIHHRNTFILSSGDTMLRLMSFLGMFAPAAEALSVDAWMTAGPPTVAASQLWPKTDPAVVRLMQLLVSIVYVRTVFWKLRGKMWWNGTAVWYPLWVDTYLRNRPPRWLLSPFCIRIATWGTLVAELSLGLLIWIDELRIPVLCAGIAMHLLFEAVLNLQLFGWTMMAGLLLFMPPETVETVLAQVAFSS